MDEKLFKIILRFIPSPDEEIITEKEFLQLVGISREEVENFIWKLFSEAIESKDELAISSAFTLSWRFGFPNGILRVLSPLLRVGWAFRQEDIVDAIEDCNFTDGIDDLYYLIVHPPKYLSPEDHELLAVKAVWALGFLGTGRALELLLTLVKSKNRRIQVCAIRQIRRIRGQRYL
ncbi:hypothetical protein [Leptospira haakeii]|uniref:HEAT repeat domain-containing protein n=1 Tax=Leptospira haakeii TaxID=2023198 RepID=A0ABX4PIX0_9LEPT|nr:hypothetical protein [Leptospira haakeii]PKA15719.1 hypothetical protein CH363_11955 [Leptospira haakeii]PKA21805.1 hypothetical protein CH377_05555 [Leptospira haakeii]